MHKTTNLPLKPSVDEEENDVLDPANIPAKGVTVRIKPYDGMAYRDRVKDTYWQVLGVSATQVKRCVIQSIF
jgi:hypothetical protein